MSHIETPTFVIDKSKVLKNIEFMVNKAKAYNLIFRPHFKTHQSLEIGRWFKEFGVDKITVSSVAMAEYFAKEWSDITIAFPFNILELNKADQLAKKINLTLLIDSVKTIDYLKSNIENPVSIFIKIDTGYHRSGVDVNDHDQINNILIKCIESNKLNFKGFLTHAGDTYECRSEQEVLNIHNHNIKKLSQLKKQFIQDYPDLMISIGDTPSCSLGQEFSGIDEIRPGNFVFFDYMQAIIGSCTTEQVAIAMACPVVAKYPNRNELMIYGGAVHFSKEFMIGSAGQKTYGQVAVNQGNKWGKPIPGMYIKKLSQEHGTIHLPGDLSGRFNVGDIVYVLPIHSCLTANLSKHYQALEKTIAHL